MMLNNDELHIVGREKEIDFLENVYMESRNCGKFVWIQGASGVGKSTLINRFIRDKSNVCIGMFDFIQSSAPYSAIINVLSDLCSILKVQHLYVTLGPQFFPILSSLSPDLEDVTTKEENIEILGNHKSVAKSKVAVEWGFVSLKRAVNEFFHAAVQTITSYTDLSIIVFLDDLQWADRASLKILISCFVESDAIPGLMCIGSYRDNEVDVKSLLWNYKLLIHGTEYECFEMSLDNLTFDDVLDLVSNVSQTYNLNSGELGRLIYEITNGNSLFVKRSLQYIVDNKMFHKTKDGASWELDSLIISTEGNVSDNLASLIRDEISHLPPEISEVLQIASLLGREIDISLFEAVLRDFGLYDTNETLINMLRCLKSKSLIAIDWERGSFHFLHDRIHQATFDFIKQKKNIQAISLRLGRTILKINDVSQGSKSKFRLLLAVDQLNRGSTLIESVQEREDLVRLNLTAAQEVLGMSAFNLAQGYLELSLRLLGGNSWIGNYALTLEIKNMLTSVFYGNGLMIEALEVIDETIAECVCDDDKRFAQVTRIEIFACNNQLDKCLSEGKHMLSLLLPSLIPLNASFAKMAYTLMNIKRTLKLMSAEDILTLPECEDSRVQCAMKIMGILAPVAFLAFQESIIPILACGMMQLTLQHGLTPWSTYALSLFGLCMTVTGDFQDAFRFASLALKMMERVGEDARTLVVVYGFIHHTQRHVVDAFNPTLRAYFISFARGDLAFSGQAISIHICARMVAGSSLEHIIDDTLCFANQLKSYNQSLVWQILVIFQRSNLELANRSSEIAKLIGNIPDDDDSFQKSLKGPHAEYHTFVLSTFAMRSRFILNDYNSAMSCARKCWRSKGFKGSLLYCSTYFFFSALTALERWKAAGVAKRFYFWRMFKKFQRLLISWTEKGNPNTLHLVVLLKAETMIAERKTSFETIQTTYRQCMAQATRSGFLHDTALAKELFGRYCLSEGKTEEAQYYLQRSKLFYYDWGALKKVNGMKLQYGDLVENSILTNDLSKSITGRPRLEIVREIESVRARTVFGMHECRF